MQNPEARAMRAIERIVGDAASIATLRDRVTQLAPFDALGNPHVPTLLLEGETGTGKGLLARIVHDSGPRARGPFVDVNCSAIPETMLEAELFGFEPGAFTDAKRAKPGLFEAASSGTLFLDEIDSLPPLLQSKLLKAIEEKSIRRLGAVSARQVDVKLIAATQKSLAGLVEEGVFRADLYHRLAVLVLELPPLRERGQDVLMLAERFLAQYAGAHGLPARRLSSSARQWLRAHAWPGNVRELGHLMERATLLGRDPEIDHETLAALALAPSRPKPSGPTTPVAPPAPGTGSASDDADEAARIRDALARAGGNVVGAARFLGLGRNALRYRMQRYGIERPNLLDREHEAPRARSRATRSLPRLARQGSTPERAPRGGPAAASSPAWEQKHVAVIAISMTMPFAPAPDESQYEPWTAAARWGQLLEDKVCGFGAVVLEKSPSRLVALLGLPLALENAPERAVQASLTVQQLSAHADQAPTLPPVELRLALHVGQVMVELDGHETPPRLIPLGDTLSMPERLMGHAGPGEILVSPALARRVAGLFELRERELRLGPAPGDRLAALSVVGILPGSSALERRAAAGLSVFVGRERELGVLREAFESARDGAGQVVFVVGEAGLGKSRLLYELHRGLDDEAHLWVESRCASYGGATAFLPIADAVRQLFVIDDRDDERAASDKLSLGVSRLEDGLAWTLPFLRQLLSLPVSDQGAASLDAATRRSETFRALAALTLRAAEVQPLVLVFEDLHWIDRESEEYLTFLAGQIAGARALLICSHRPGYRSPFPDRSYHTRVSLRALSTPDMARLAGDVLGADELPAEIRELIARKAEGNPFFVEEVMRSLVESGVLRGERGKVELGRRLDEIVVPGSIHDVLMARIDRLELDSRRALQVAAIIGREFALRLLERITQAGAQMRTHVEELRALELIYEKSRSPELAYMFKHALTHDVAYASVIAEQRRALHRVVGLAIEELYADRLAEHYETLAYHFGRAEDWERALRYHDLASEKAAEGYANRTVIAHCEEALRIAARLGEQAPPELPIRLQERLALARFYVNDFIGSADAYATAAEASQAPRGRALHLANSALASVWGGAYDRARELLEEVRQVTAAHDVPGAEAMRLYVHGFFAGVFDGDVQTYHDLNQQALRLCRSADDEAVVAMAHFSFAQVAEWTGDYRSAL
ncbi:MAG TPA: sigma 54-interacting transcriptional regulator, partial [Candidatus Bathyarchaeia archaeon]|nr:sigma 54-interacting transcriptional regulator [Candidatus Bathyarchaeia archaeon]